MSDPILAPVNAATTSSEASTRPLVPREHGAYAQLGLPLLAALSMGRPAFAALLLAVASVSAFLAHESLLIVLGHRGARARRVDGPRARRLLAVLGGLALVSGACGLALAPEHARLATLAPLALSAVVAGLIAKNLEKTTPGEAISATAMASASLPVALATGVPPLVAWSAVGTWAIAFCAATWAVRSVIAFQKKAEISLGRRVLPLLGLGVLALSFHALGLLPTMNAAATGPITLLSIAVAAVPPHPRHLRRVGWSLAVATMLTAGLLVWGAWC